MSNLEDIQDLIDRAEKYRTEVTKSKLDNSFIQDIDFTNIMKQHQTETDINNKDNIYVKCKISRKDSITGCTRTVKISRINENGSIANNIIEVRIPSGIENGQHIILKCAGNYVNNRYSDLIIKVIIR